MAKAKANKALWGGRFAKGPAEALMAFSRSLEVDKRMAVEDITGSLAHVDMLKNTGLLPQKDAKTLEKGLKILLKDAQEERFFFSPDDEDIHMYHERRLVDLIGEPGKRLHMARSRNDQVITDARLYTKTRLHTLRGLLLTIIGTLTTQAEAHADVPFMGFTHLQAAMPVSGGHWFMAYAGMLRRDADLLDAALAATDVCPLGSGALAGTSLPVDRRLTAKTLGFAAVHPNSLDAVSDRDFMAHAQFALAMTAVHLSRMAEDLVIYASHEVRLVAIEDSFATGSSMMPHKKNPDAAELMRGKAGLLLGDLQSLLTLIKGTPLAYNRDFQDDKPIFFRSLDTAEALLSVTAPFLATLRLLPYPFAQKDPLGLTAATDLAEWLVLHGMPFREAHEQVGLLVREALSQDVSLAELIVSGKAPGPLQALADKAEAKDRKHLTAFLQDPGQTIHRKKSLGGGSPASVRQQVKATHAWLKERRGA